MVSFSLVLLVAHNDRHSPTVTDVPVQISAVMIAFSRTRDAIVAFV